MMGTEIFKIDAEMAEKIEVEVGNPHLNSDRNFLMSIGPENSKNKVAQKLLV